MLLTDPYVFFQIVGSTSGAGSAREHGVSSVYGSTLMCVSNTICVSKCASRKSQQQEFVNFFINKSAADSAQQICCRSSTAYLPSKSRPYDLLSLFCSLQQDHVQDIANVHVIQHEDNAEVRKFVRKPITNTHTHLFFLSCPWAGVEGTSGVHQPHADALEQSQVLNSSVMSWTKTQPCL